MIFDVVKILLIFFVIALGIVRPESVEVILASLTDAYIAVSSFVALTLAIFYLLEDKFQFDTKAFLEKYSYIQVPVAAGLGALPGCGGAIMVITQYVRGRISFGSVVAVLTATMGDAAFLLLAQEPLTGLLIMGVGFSIGIVSGYIVDAIHGQDFLRPSVEMTSDPKCPTAGEQGDRKPLIPIEVFWVLLILPGIVFGIMSAFQLDVDHLFGNQIIPMPMTIVGVGGAILCVGMWLLSPFFAFDRQEAGGNDVVKEAENPSVARNSYMSSEYDHPIRRVIKDTNFITAWVVFAFLIFEIFTFLSAIDLNTLFRGYTPFIPFVAILFGLIPGCGPQILVTTLYLERLIPFSAQLGNAISNDGDALFPAIALAPKASVLATLYSAIPAVLVAYGYMFLFE
jgi:hypothetical protein